MSTINIPTGSDTASFAERIAAAIETHDIEAVVALYAEDGTQIHPFAEGIVVGHDAIRAGDGALLRAFPDVTVERRTVATAGRTVLVEAVLRMTHAGPLELEDGTELPPSGRRVELPLVWVIDLDDRDLILQERSYLDTAAFFRQLGLQA